MNFLEENYFDEELLGEDKDEENETHPQDRQVNIDWHRSSWTGSPNPPRLMLEEEAGIHTKLMMQVIEML